MKQLTQTEIKIKNQQLEILDNSIREVKERLVEATMVFNIINKSKVYNQDYGQAGYELTNITYRLANLQDGLKSLENRREKLIPV